MLDYLFILAGFIVAQGLVINIKFLSRSRGYILRAALWIWPFLLTVSVVELVLAGAIFKMVANPLSSLTPLDREHWAVLLGVLIVILPNTIEYFILYRKASEKKVIKDFVKTFRRLNLDIMYNFAKAIRTRMQQDVFDCQAGRGFSLGLSPKEMGRRIRLLYACHMDEIAKQQQNPKLLKLDINVSPWQKLYLLIEHLGRRRLIKQLSERPPSPAPLMNWNGKERRKQRGTPADRKDLSTMQYTRRGDKKQQKQEAPRIDNS